MKASLLALSFFVFAWAVNAKADPLCQSRSEPLKSCAEKIDSMARQSFTDWALVKLEAPSQLTIHRDGEVIKVRGGSILKDGDVLEGDGRLTLQSPNQSVAINGPYKLKVSIQSNHKPAPLVEIEQIFGFLHWVSRQCKEVPCETIQIKTPTSIVGIRGTEFISEISPETEKYYLYEGQIEIRRGDEVIELSQSEKLIWPIKGQAKKSALDAADLLRRQEK